MELMTKLTFLLLFAFQSFASSCKDATGQFNVGDDRRTCEWAGRRDTANRCKDSIISQQCPVTCDTCPKSPVSAPTANCKDATNRFNVGNDKHSCEWAGRKDTVNRCKISIVSRKCPVTCDVCTVSPVNAPASAPVSAPYGKGKGKKKRG